MLRKCETSSRNVQTDTETGSEGAHALSEALSFNTTLKVLELGCAKKNAKFDTTPTNTATKKEQTANKLGIGKLLMALFGSNVPGCALSSEA